MSLMGGEDIAAVQGPSASLQHGEAGPINQMANSLKNQSPGAYNAAQPPQGPQQELPAAASAGIAGGGGASTATPQASPSGPTQPNPLLKVAHPVLSPRPQPTPGPWRDELQGMANHPLAGHYLKAIAKLASEK